MTRHAKDTLGSASISQVLNLAFAVPTTEAVCAEGLVSGQDGQIFNLVSTVVTAVCAVVTYEGAIAEEEEVRIGVEEGAASVAAEAVYVPSIAS